MCEQELQAAVYDKDLDGKPESLGSGTVPLKGLLAGEPQIKIIELQDAGRLYLELEADFFSRVPPDPAESSRENLSDPALGGGEPDPVAPAFPGKLMCRIIRAMQLKVRPGSGASGTVREGLSRARARQAQRQRGQNEGRWTPNSALLTSRLRI